jgi:hypothetical protein
MERLIDGTRVRFRIFSGSFQFASGFCSSPPSASPSCCSRHHCSVLCSLCLYFASQFRRGRQNCFQPTFLFNSGRTHKVSRLGRARRTFQHSGSRCSCTVNHRRGLREGVILSLGGRRLVKYCASNARSAAATVGPIPTIPSSTVGPSSAIHSSPRKNNWGRRTADGLSGWDAQ